MFSTYFNPSWRKQLAPRNWRSQIKIRTSYSRKYWRRSEIHEKLQRHCIPLFRSYQLLRKQTSIRLSTKILLLFCRIRFLWWRTTLGFGNSFSHKIATSLIGICSYNASLGDHFKSNWAWKNVDILRIHGKLHLLQYYRRPLHSTFMLDWAKIERKEIFNVPETETCQNYHKSHFLHAYCWSYQQRIWSFETVLRNIKLRKIWKPCH